MHLLRLRLAALFCVPFFAVACAALHAAQIGPSAQALDALAGEYAEPAEPDTPEDVYVRDGRLIFESEVFAPTELIPETTTRFRLAGSRTTMQFTLDGSGRGSSVVSSSSPSVLYLRTGNPVRHVFHDTIEQERRRPRAPRAVDPRPQQSAVEQLGRSGRVRSHAGWYDGQHSISIPEDARGFADPGLNFTNSA